MQRSRPTPSGGSCWVLPLMALSRLLRDDETRAASENTVF